ncbi:hypothetical protein OG594_38210 [Streptomyces sp. NBC_01214]|uniref:hypothetical protein n=1 Tax=Streptomyces sp. NBC_01214 TaxID=2903777 RepID=UPI002257FCC9|nr:hypothetical protein [Streptomyces sp. NBC_01214]MCX4807387.1 hypothetical protein [Streptomyces sp. NBC_01214]
MISGGVSVQGGEFTSCHSLRSPTALLVVDASEVAEPFPVVTEIWSDYIAVPESYAPRPGMARTVPLIELLHDADVTPRPPLPLRPELSTDERPTARTAALGDLIKSGAIVHHRPGPPSGSDEAPS